MTSGMPAVMIDSPAVHEVFGLPEDDDIIVVDRGSKRGRTALKVSTVWEYSPMISVIDTLCRDNKAEGL
jgi:hypothetical protein